MPRLVGGCPSWRRVAAARPHAARGALSHRADGRARRGGGGLGIRRQRETGLWGTHATCSGPACATLSPNPGRGREIPIGQPPAKPVPDLRPSGRSAFREPYPGPDGRGDLRIRLRPGRRLHGHDTPIPRPGRGEGTTAARDHGHQRGPDRRPRLACRKLATGIEVRRKTEAVALGAYVRRDSPAAPAQLASICGPRSPSCPSRLNRSRLSLAKPWRPRRLPALAAPSRRALRWLPGAGRVAM